MGAMMDKAVFEKIARMEVHGVPANQIAMACGLSEGRISQIKQLDEYREIEQEIAGEKFEEQQLLNEGWDGVETHALGHVLKAMQGNPDPEFALRVAAVANKANRRGAIGVGAIQAGSAGRTVINLNVQYAQSLQENFVVAPRDEKDIAGPQKDVNMLSVDKVHTLLTTAPKQSIEADVNELLDNE